MKETSSQASARRHERLFLLCAAAAAVVCVVLAVWLAPPRLAPGAAEAETPMVQLIRVDLNTADLETLCILPNVGEKRAQAILDYRAAHGPFRRVAEAAAVPGLNESIVASWDELAYVS